MNSDNIQQETTSVAAPISQPADKSEDLVVTQSTSDHTMTEEAKTSQEESYRDVVSQIGEGANQVFVARSAEAVNKMLDDSRLLDGKKTTEQLAAEASKEVDPEDVNANKLPLPAEQFKEFKEITKDNEEEFDYFVGCVLVQFLETFKDKALEFPSCLDSDGRVRIHTICNYLGIASHSQG